MSGTPPPPKVIEEDGEDESVTGGGERHGVGHYLSSGSQICLLEAKACEMQMGPAIDAAREVQAYLVLLHFALLRFTDVHFHQHPGKTLHQPKGDNALKAQMMVRIF